MVAIVVLGSGGHTAEMLRIVENVIMKNKRLNERVYLYVDTDTLSLSKITALDKKALDYVAIPRTRKVGQSWISTMCTFMAAFIASFSVIWRHRPSLIICNGPGTCVPICLIAMIFNCLFVTNTKIVFCESLARVKTLSLTGKILYHIAHVFIVQWPELKEKYPKSIYIGRFV